MCCIATQLNITLLQCLKRWQIVQAQVQISTVLVLRKSRTIGSSSAQPAVMRLSERSRTYTRVSADKDHNWCGKPRTTSNVKPLEDKLQVTRLPNRSSLFSSSKATEMLFESKWRSWGLAYTNGDMLLWNETCCLEGSQHLRKAGGVVCVALCEAIHQALWKNLEFFGSSVLYFLRLLESRYSTLVNGN